MGCFGGGSRLIHPSLGWEAICQQTGLRRVLRRLGAWEAGVGIQVSLRVRRDRFGHRVGCGAGGGGAHGACPSTLPPESPAVCPSCGSDHVVLLTGSPGTPSGEQRQGEQLSASSQSPSAVQDPPGHSDLSNRASGISSQAVGSHDRHSWSLSPREYH